MRAFQLWCIVVAMVGVVAGGCSESYGPTAMRGEISDHEATPRLEAAETPAMIPLTINRTGPKPPPAIAPFDAEQARKHQEAWAEHLGLPVEWINSIGMTFVLIPPGEFVMGSPEDEEDRDENEGPRHRVRITKPFLMGVHEVTQSQYEAVMGDRPWEGEGFVKEGHDYAASYVSWHKAMEFCRRLSRREDQTYRLPTEAEWEHACRGGTRTAYHFGDDLAQLGQYDWYIGNAWDMGEYYARDVGQKKPNAFGLYDMHGNVGEWCADWYDRDYYADAPVDDPAGPDSGVGRVCRGGSWSLCSTDCRSARRYGEPPEIRVNRLGFRVAAVPSGD